MVRPKLLTTAQAAELLGVSEDLFEDLARAEGWIIPVHLGNGRRPLKRWDIQDINALRRVLHGRTRRGNMTDDEK